MKNFQNQDLIGLLADDTSSARMLALHFLSEGDADDASILPAVFAGWDRWGADAAYPEFPLLSYVYVPAATIAETIERARAMLVARKLTDTSTRCAGKLIEQVCNLPSAELRDYQKDIEGLVAQSKIFFRVDASAIGRRLELKNWEADQLAQQLDRSIEALSQKSDNSRAFHQGLEALEALRREHPSYLDMATAIAHSPPDNGPQAVSFQLSIHSLIQFSQEDTEAALAKHLLDPRESIHSNALEALVKLGTPLAAAYMISQFDTAAEPGQRWIARGLQRVRGLGLADEIANLRENTSDPALWLMLLVAETRQFELASLPRILDGLQRVQVYSGALMDAMNVYVRLHDESTGARVIQQAFMDYLQRMKQQL